MAESHQTLQAEFGSRMRDIKTIVKMLENESGSDLERTMLSYSFLYSDSRLDPSPIIHFGSKIPLYVYIDPLNDCQDGFKSALRRLYAKLKKAGFAWKKVYTCKAKGRLTHFTENELTQWIDKTGNPLHLIFIKANSLDACRAVYNAYSSSEYEYYDNYIQPKYICNVNTVEESSGIEEYRVLNMMYGHAEYIMGHTNNPTYRCVSDLTNFDKDDPDSEKIPLFQKMYSYIF